MIDRELIEQYRRVATAPAMLATAAPFVPEPTAADFEFGEIRRYFAQPVNQRFGEITEVSRGAFNSLREKSLYNVVELRWKISGPAEDILDASGEVEVRGIRSANAAAVRQAAKTMPAIKQRLTNLFQLWQGF